MLNIHVILTSDMCVVPSLACSHTSPCNYLINLSQVCCMFSQIITIVLR